jgi:glycosyltransferase involved in cell wall biosynthesis
MAFHKSERLIMKYVLVSAARNEEEFIEKTLQSVVAQTILPQRWVIVSDGSTDRTDEIVEAYAKEYAFIELLRASHDSVRNFGSKAKAIQAGIDRLKDISADFIGNLDADVSFPPDYYQNMFLQFEKNPKLGLVGGVRRDFCNGKFVNVKVSRNSVGGPFQFFRRKCFEKIGGYLPLEYGGVDAAAEMMTRMYGWEVESFPDYVVHHHRCTGSANRTVWERRYRAGVRDYLLGYHPLFQLFRAFSRLLRKPYFLGSIVWMWGYVWSALNRFERPVPDNFVAFIRNEQVERMKTAVFKKNA